MSIINQIEQDLLNVISSSEWATDLLKKDNTTVKIIFRESSDNADVLSDEVSGTEIFVIGTKSDLLDVKIDDILMVGTRTFKVVSKEVSDFKVRLNLEEL